MAGLHKACVASLALVACGVLACSSASYPAVLGGSTGGDGVGSTSGGGGSGGGGGGDSSSSSPSGSEVAVSIVSGALNNNAQSGVAFNLRTPKRSRLERALAFINPIGTAYAATWSCSGETLNPVFAGPGAYAFTPPTCQVEWGDDKVGASRWGGPFTLSYGSSCDAESAFMAHQRAGCEMIRTSDMSGDTRTIQGPNGNTYAINHDTHGAGTGWDSSLSPAPSDGGVVTTCGVGGCASSGTVVVSGSHVTGTVDVDKVVAKIWDHTITTDGSGIAVTGAGASRTVTGSVTVQHNLLKYVSVTTFEDAGYGEPTCCFPTTGSVATTYTNGEGEVGKTEKLVFSTACGEATLTDTKGNTAALTLEQCL